jgi:hypothetical protein
VNQAAQPLPEIALTEDEVTQILQACRDSAVLVGGQALAFWVLHYQVTPPEALQHSITSDADYFGDQRAARKLHEALKDKGWKLYIPAPEDPTPQTAKLSLTVPGQGIKQIDFLGSVAGLGSGLVDRAVEVPPPQPDLMPVRVLHPLDVLDSRMQNLARLPQKRTVQGIAQAHLAIEVARAHVEDILRSEGATTRFNHAINRLAQIAQDRDLQETFIRYGLDVLGCVPVSEVPPGVFHAKRWPQILKETARVRARRQKLLGRISTVKARKPRPG